MAIINLNLIFKCLDTIRKSHECLSPGFWCLSLESSVCLRVIWPENHPGEGVVED